MRPMIPQEMAIEEIIRLLAPVLSHHQGMAARSNEDRFRKALETLALPADLSSRDTNNVG